MNRYRFFRHFFWKAECYLCRSLVSKAKYAMEQHANWHFDRDEWTPVGGGTHRAFCDVTVLGEGHTQSTGWRTISGGPS